MVNQFINLGKNQQNIIYVGGTGKGNFSSIKDAINVSEPGDIIYVFNGLYFENNITFKEERISLIGEDKNFTILDGLFFEKDKCDPVINIQSNSINLRSLNIRNGYCGVFINGYNNTIENCIISDNGINTINCSLLSGAFVLSNSDNNYIYENLIFNNSDSALYLFESENNSIYLNNITKNTNGLYFANSNNNTVNKNSIINNTFTGLYIDNQSVNNMIYQNNFIKNSQNAIDESENNWSFKGQGNYWDDYNGSDNDNDGFGDTSYNISGAKNIDQYPYIASQEIKKIKEEFTVNDESLYTMLVVGMIVAVIFVIPIAYYWRKKYFT